MAILANFMAVLGHFDLATLRRQVREGRDRESPEGREAVKKKPQIRDDRCWMGQVLLLRRPTGQQVEQPPPPAQLPPPVLPGVRRQCQGAL